LARIIYQRKNLNFLSVTFTATADNVYNLSDEKVREYGGGIIMVLKHVFVFFTGTTACTVRRDCIPHNAHTLVLFSRTRCNARQ
jgi:hypothetical protein